MRNRLRQLLLVLIAVLALGNLAACGDDEGGDDSGAGAAPETSAPTSSAFPVTLTHKFGSTTIETQPERIVALSNEEDTLAALGITPIAYAQNLYLTDEPMPWLEGRLDLSDSTPIDTAGELNLEEIAALQPDLILATNFYGLETVYEKLSKIAPTVAFTEAAGIATWQENSTMIGQAVGRAGDTEKAVAETEAAISKLKADLPGLDGKTFSYSFYYAPGSLAVIDDPETVSVQLYSELGMQMAPGIAEHVKDRSLSMERLDALDADFVLMGYASDKLKTDMDQKRQYSELSAVKAGQVLQVDDFTAGVVNNPTMLNIPWQLEQLEPTLAKVAG